MAAAGAEYHQLDRTTNPTTANQALLYTEDIFALANTSFADSAACVGSGTCPSGCLLTIVPFDASRDRLGR